MRLAEIRDLDGPNLFLLEPAIKVEIVLDDPSQLAAIAARLRAAVPDGAPAMTEPLEDVNAAASNFVRSFQPETRINTRWMETQGHFAIAFSWTHRRFALGVARLLERLALGE